MQTLNNAFNDMVSWNCNIFIYHKTTFKYIIWNAKKPSSDITLLAMPQFQARRRKTCRPGPSARLVSWLRGTRPTRNPSTAFYRDTASTTDRSERMRVGVSGCLTFGLISYKQSNKVFLKDDIFLSFFKLYSYWKLPHTNMWDSKISPENVVICVLVYL